MTTTELIGSMVFIRDACYRILDGKLSKDDLAEELDDIQSTAENAIAAYESELTGESIFDEEPANAG